MSADLTVVMPLHNGAALVGEAIESVLANADGLLELLVVDDASTDDGAQIAAGFGDPVRVIAHDRQRGPAVARNTAIRQARGELIGFLDADDIWIAGSLDPRRAAFADSAVLAVGARVQPVVGDPPVPFRHPFGIQVAAIWARPEAFALHGLFDERRTYGEDVDWMMRLREANAMTSSIHDVVAHYRVRPGSLMRDRRQAQLGTLEAIRSSLRRRSGQAMEAGGEP